MKIKKTLYLWILFLLLLTILGFLVGERRLQNIFLRLHDGAKRELADMSIMPWNSVVLLRIGKGGKCTGVLIKQNIILTAAHCVVEGKHRRQVISPDNIYIYSHALNGANSAVGRVESITLDREYLRSYERGTERSQLARDWAILHTSSIEGLTDFARLAEVSQRPPYTVFQAGYGRDSVRGLRKDEDCRIFEHISKGGSVLLRHNCLTSPGDSGGPLFIFRDGRWHVIGINIAILGYNNSLHAYGVSLHELMRAL